MPDCKHTIRYRKALKRIRKCECMCGSYHPDDRVIVLIHKRNGIQYRTEHSFYCALVIADEALHPERVKKV